MRSPWCWSVCRPLVLLASALSAGVAAGAIFEFPTFLIVIAATVACVCVAAAALTQKRVPDVALVLLAVALFAFGSARAADALRSARIITAPLDGKAKLACEGKLIGDPVPREWGASMDVRLEACGTNDAKTRAQGSVRLNAREHDSALVSGDRVKFVAKFSLPREFKDPGAFSYRNYLITHGIAAVASASGAVKVSGESISHSPLRWIAKARRVVDESIAASVPLPARAIVDSMTTGYRSRMTPELNDEFQLAGLSHILSISGLHVAYVALAIYLMMRFTIGRCAWLLVRIPLQRLAALVTIPAVWLFVIFAGSGTAAVRSALMITVYLAGVAAGLRQDSLTTIAASVIAILVCMPLTILDVSFQLSASAVAGIAVIAGPLSRLLKLDMRGGCIAVRALRWIGACVVVSFAASVATAPLVAYHFKIFTGVGLFTNVIAIPLAGFVLQPLLLLGTLAALIAPWAAHWVWAAAGYAAEALMAIAHVSSQIGGPLSGGWAPSAVEAVLAYAVIAAALLWRRLPVRHACALSLAALLCLDVTSLRVAPFFDRSLSVTYFDVGQGDAALVRFPGGSTMLIDGGGVRGSEFDVGRNVLAPTLWRMGVRRIDWMLLSHPHHDHYAGLAYVAERFAPKVLWTNGLAAPPDEKGEWDAFAERLAAARVPMVPVEGDGMEFKINGATVRIFSREKDAEDLNDTSLVTLVSYGSEKYLFTGDLSSRGESELMANYGDLAAGVLKVGHHGSRDASSSGFLAVVKPRIAVISAGEGNRYGLPNRYALERLADSGARIYRTDHDGAVTVKTDGKNLEVSTYVQRR